MEFASNLKMFEKENFSHAFKVWMDKRKLDLEEGKVNMSSNLNFIIEGDEPFFIAFDEFHMKHIQNAPGSFHGWKIFAIAASNLNGHLQIIHLKAMSSGIEKLVSVEKFALQRHTVHNGASSVKDSIIIFMPNKGGL
ncbi:uncharacterized protein LOC123258387 [Drosophila ananassae]|uniref:uncharacterized protein LOC123258387 n=1 Tax=Drosophila ananassae TaxID=7217 RepID=UPI001CFFB705|nr:uncharacterized protein LOC123258387 [Drosophila ananassae]